MKPSSRIVGSPPRPVHGRGERGFMIVGVVLFVLALSILGLSLFSLSSYEAGFLGTEIHRANAFHSALGGIDRAKFVLAARDSLGAIKLIEDQDNVVYARARYVDTPDDTVSAPMDWSGTRDLEVRVLAEVRGQRRMVEARYKPERRGALYRNLITSASGVTVVTVSPSFPFTVRNTQTYLSGNALQASSNTTWSTTAQTVFGINVTVGSVSLPKVADYISTWAPTAISTPGPASGERYELNAAGPNFRHFIGGASPAAGTFPGFGLANAHPNDPEIIVSGTAVWLLPGGAHFDQRVRVTGTANDRLIIVASKGTNSAYSPGPPAGLRFHGGLDSPVVPVILVSDGTVALDQVNDYPNSNTIVYLSIVAANVYFMGPEVGAQTRYRHVDGIPYNDADVLDDLATWGILPDVPGGTNTSYPLVAGTWREVTETNPN